MPLMKSVRVVVTIDSVVPVDGSYNDQLAYLREHLPPKMSRIEGFEVSILEKDRVSEIAEMNLADRLLSIITDPWWNARLNADEMDTMIQTHKFLEQSMLSEQKTPLPHVTPENRISLITKGIDWLRVKAARHPIRGIRMALCTCDTLVHPDNIRVHAETCVPLFRRMIVEG